MGKVRYLIKRFPLLEAIAWNRNQMREKHDAILGRDSHRMLFGGFKLVITLSEEVFPT